MSDALRFFIECFCCEQGKVFDEIFVHAEINAKLKFKKWGGMEESICQQNVSKKSRELKKSLE